MTAGEALQTLAFWQLAGSFFTCGFSMSLLSAHGIPMLTDHGYTPMFASWALGVLGGSSIGFTVMLGALSDRFGRRPVLATIYAGRILIFARPVPHPRQPDRRSWRWPSSAASRWRAPAR